MYLLALGANLPSALGVPHTTLEAALDCLAERGLSFTARSRWFWTPAYPPGSGPAFVNGAARFDTALGPHEVLHALHAVERELGRTRDRRWAPRACDLDLLAWDDAVLPDAPTVERWMNLPAAGQTEAAPDTLVLPHPRMHERAFVLRPLLDVAPDWRHPLLGRTAAELAADLPPELCAGIEPL